MRLITDESGAVLRRHDYQPFGEEIPQNPPLTPSLTDKRLVTGQERDFETGLDYVHARYLATGIDTGTASPLALGRFTTTDPLGSTAEALVDPQGYNVYAHVQNNPLKYVDPDGLDLVDSVGVLLNLTAKYIPTVTFRTETVEYLSRMGDCFQLGGLQLDPSLTTRKLPELPSPSVTWARVTGFVEGAAAGFAASVDGAVPFVDPLARLKLYDPSGPGLGFSKVVVGQSLTLLASFGAPIVGALADGKKASCSVEAARSLIEVLFASDVIGKEEPRPVGT